MRLDDSAEVVLILDQDEISWPYHDAVRQDAIGLVRSDPRATEAATEAAGEPVTLETEALSGQSHVLLRASASTTTAAEIGADAAADWLGEENVAARRDRLDDEISVLTDHLAEIDARAAETSDSQADELLRRSGQLASEIDDLTAERDLLVPQIRRAGDAEPADSAVRPWIALIAALAASAVTFAVIE